MYIVVVLCLARLFVEGEAEIHGVRLRGGSTPGQGKVEVKRGTQWGSVCDEHWTINEADVVCRQLGYESAVAALKGSPYGNTRGPIWITDVRCTGDEETLSECFYRDISTTRMRLYQNTDEIRECSYANQAGVKCVESAPPHANEINIGDKFPSSGATRQHSNLVTVKVSGKWIPICADAWTSKEAAVACRQAGKGFMKITEKISSNLDSIPSYTSAVTEVNCKGHERSLQDCGLVTATSSCFYYGSVVCDKDAPDISINITELETSISIRRKRENRMLCAKEEKCISTSGLEKSANDILSSNVIRVLMQFSSNVQNYGTADFRPPRLEGGWHYHKCHKHYHSISEFARYELRDESKNIIEVGHKVSFCLQDSACVVNSDKKYRCTAHKESLNQGISIGCMDKYSRRLDCQWIDVTDVPDGEYTLSIHLNPYRLVDEQDFTNNLVVCKIKIYNGEASGQRCHQPSDFEEYVPVKER